MWSGDPDKTMDLSHSLIDSSVNEDSQTSVSTSLNFTGCMAIPGLATLKSLTFSVPTMLCIVDISELMWRVPKSTSKTLCELMLKLSLCANGKQVPVA
jgi:hypothetical protein